MSKVFLLIRKELKIYFTSSLAYVIAGIFSLVCGWIFVNYLTNFVNTLQTMPQALQGQVSFIDHVVIKFFASLNFLMLLICPLMTMRLFAEEKKQNSIELLFGAPITDFQILLGKYLSSLIIMIFMLSLTFIFPIILSFSGLYEINIIYSGYLGLFANLCLYLALGTMASSFTDNQIVSAIVTILSIMFLWMISWVSSMTSNYLIAEIFRYIGLVYHYQNVTRGILSTVDLVYYLSWLVMILLICKKRLESRNW